MDIHNSNDTHRRLQALLGESPLVSVEPFVNVMRTQKVDHVLAVRPQTLEEVQRVVQAVSTLRLRLRPIGGAFSWSPLFPDVGQVALYLGRLDRHDGPRIQLTQVCAAQYELTALCNVTVDELITFQLANQVELASNVIFRSGTVAGIVSTSSHGSGAEIAKSVSDLIVRMRVVDAHGALRTLDVRSDPHLMNAARGSLGLFGVIYDVTFRVGPKTMDIATNDWLPVQDVFYDTQRLRSLIFGHDSLQLFWFPMSSFSSAQALRTMFRKRLLPGEWDHKEDAVMVRTVTRIPPGSTVKGKKMGPKSSPLDKWEYRLMRYAMERLPSVGPFISRFAGLQFKEDYNGSAIQEHVHAVHFVKGVDVFGVWEMEFAIDLDSNFARITQAINDLGEELQAAGLQGHFPVNVLVEMRVTHASDLYLAPGHVSHPANGGSGYTVHLEFVSFAQTPYFNTFASRIAHRWMAAFGCRLHWGKQWSFIPGVEAYLQQTLSREFTLFRKALEQSNVDPNRIFFNSTLESLIYGGPTYGGQISAVNPPPVQARPALVDVVHSPRSIQWIHGANPVPCTRNDRPAHQLKVVSVQ